MNLPRQIFLKQLAETPLLPLANWPDHQVPILTGQTPYYFTEYNRPNPWIWPIEGQPFLEANKVLQWNWSDHLLSRGWWSTVSAILFAFMAMCFAFVSCLSFFNANRTYQPT